MHRLNVLSILSKRSWRLANTSILNYRSLSTKVDNSVTNYESTRLLLQKQSIERRLHKPNIDLGLGPIEQSKSVLEETIIKAHSVDHIKDLIRASFSDLDVHCLSECFQSIDDILKYSSNKDETKMDLLSSKEVIVN